MKSFFLSLYFAVSMTVMQHITIIFSEYANYIFLAVITRLSIGDARLYSSIINNSDLFLPAAKSLGCGSVAIRRLSYTFNGGFSPLTFINASSLPPRNCRTH